MRHVLLIAAHMSTLLSERLELDSLKADQIDRQQGVIRRVRVLGTQSKNVRHGQSTRYSEQACKDGVPLYEGVRVNVDHDKTNPRSRPLKDTVGVLRNPQWDDEAKAVVADLHLIKSHSLFEEILERAEKFSQTFGLSHVSKGELDKRSGEVTKLYEVISVDLVGSPATNSGLFESEEPVMPTIKQAMANAPAGNEHRLMLFEMEEHGSLTETIGEMPVDVAPDASAGDTVKAALVKAVSALLDAAPVDKLRKIIKDLMGKTGGGSEGGEPSKTKEKSDEKPMEESLGKLTEKMDLLIESLNKGTSEKPPRPVRSPGISRETDPTKTVEELVESVGGRGW